MHTERRTRSAVPAYRILNELRRARGLAPATRPHQPNKITRPLLRQLAVEVWKKYPQSLTDPNYQLGELTVALVEQEIAQRVSDLRRGVVAGKAALKDYFN